MDLRRIRYFVAVAEELHFGRAAARLNMAQPPLSEQIRKFESELGIQLFHRNNRNVELTAAGEIILSGARETLSGMERAFLSAQRVARGETGHINLGFVSSTCITILPGIMRYLSKSLPEIDIDIWKFSSSNDAGSALRRGEIDLALIHPTLLQNGKSVTVIRDPVLVALWSDHPLAEEEEIGVPDLASEGLIMFPPNKGNYINKVTEEICKKGGSPMHIARYADDVYTMLCLVSARSGISFVPSALQQIPVNNVTYLSLTDSNATFNLEIAWRNEIIPAFLDRTIQALQEYFEII